MNAEILYERDLLYPTESVKEPGSVHVQMLGPNKDACIPVVIESKTSHNPLQYIDTIVRIMQSDIFDRVFIDIKKNVTMYVKTGASIYKLVYNSDRFEYVIVDSVE